MKRIILLGVLFVFAAVLFGCTQSNYPPVNMDSLSASPAGFIGDANAPVVVVEYSDYQCPICRVWAIQSKSALISEYVNTGKVRFEFRDFPLKQHALSFVYAQAARCAGEQGQYFAMHDKIYSEQDKISGGETVTVNSVVLSDIAVWAKDLGLDSAKFNLCLESGKFDAAINANEGEGAGIGVTGTPSFVIGKNGGAGELVIGAVPFSTLKSEIDAFLK